MTTTPAWIRRFRAARVSLPTWATEAPARCAYATNASGAFQVHSWDLTTGEHRQLTTKPEGVRGGAPLPDGSGVAWFDDRRGDERGRIVVTPFSGGEAQPLLPQAPDGWGCGASVRPGRTVVGVADDDGFSIWVSDDDGARCIHTTPRYLEVGGLSRDASLLAVAHCEHGDVLHPRTRILDPTDGRVLADLSDGDHNTVVPAAWSRTPGDNRLVLLADASGRTRPEILDVTSGERSPLAADELPGEVGVADWYPDGRALLCTHDHLGRTSLLRYDIAAGSWEALDVSEGSIAGARIRDDGSLWYAFTSAASPRQVRVLDNDGDRALLTPPGEPAPDGVGYRSLHYPNGAGDEVHAFLAQPHGDGPFPLVVDVHGGPMAQSVDAFDASVQAWVDHGYAVLQPNYRGSTGYGKDWEDRLLGDPGLPECVDVRAGRDHLVAEGIADPDRVVLTGGSWGGYVTLLGLGVHPESWSCGVAVVPVADYEAAYADEAPSLKALDETLFGGSPETVGDLYRDRSPITYVDAVRAPVLIITGENDTRCPKRQVDNYVAALASRGLPHAYEVFDAGHGSLEISEQIHHQALSMDFAAAHLGTTPAMRED